MAKRKKAKAKQPWWAEHPLWRIRFHVDHFFRVASVIKGIPALPKNELSTLADWQWFIENPDYRQWTGIYYEHSQEMILTLVKNLRESLAGNRKAIIRLKSPRGLPIGWHARCIGAVEWFCAVFPEKMNDAGLLHTFLWTSRQAWNYEQGVHVAKQIDQCWLELAAVKGISGRAVGPHDVPHSTVQACYDYIVRNPGRGGKEVAETAGVTPEHFRSYIVPQLREMGIKNDRGYRKTEKQKA